MRNTVYKNNKLKGKNLLTAESLKAARVGILKDKYIQGKYEVRNLWTTDDCILKRIEYLFSENKVIKWHWNTMINSCVRVNNIFRYFTLFFVV